MAFSTSSGIVNIGSLSRKAVTFRSVFSLGAGFQKQDVRNSHCVVHGGYIGFKFQFSIYVLGTVKVY